MSTVIIRVIASSGRSRLEMSTSNTMNQLKEEIAKRFNLTPAQVKLCSDAAHKKPIVSRDTDKIKFKNGDQIYVSN